MRTYLTLAALGIAVTLSGAHATVLVDARSTSMAQAGPQPVSSFAHARNGALVPGENIAAANGFSNAGPIVLNATSAFANTTQLDGGIYSTAQASADLATGTLRARAEAGSIGGGGFSAAFAYASWTETVTFNNTSGSTQELGFFWQTDGVVQSGPAVGPFSGSESVTSSILLAVNNIHFSFIGMKDASGGYDTLGGAQFNYLNGGSFFSYQPKGNNNNGVWTATATGTESGLLSATLLVPDGLASIDITTFLNVDCRNGSICDFGNTATFSFGNLPNGLTWTSESGDFLTTGTPDVPVPAALGFAVLAFGSLGALSRRAK